MQAFAAAAASACDPRVRLQSLTIPRLQNGSASPMLMASLRSRPGPCMTGGRPGGRWHMPSINGESG